MRWGSIPIHSAPSKGALVEPPSFVGVFSVQRAPSSTLFGVRGAVVSLPTIRCRVPSSVGREVSVPHWPPERSNGRDAARGFAGAHTARERSEELSSAKGSAAGEAGPRRGIERGLDRDRLQVCRVVHGGRALRRSARTGARRLGAQTELARLRLGERGSWGRGGAAKIFLITKRAPLQA